MEYTRFTQWTENGASLILDNPQNAEEARMQLMEKFKLACNKLAELEDKIEQGYIKILPVKAGDKIYVVPSKVNYDLNCVNRFHEHNRVYEQTVNEIRFFQNGVYMVYSCDYQQNHHSEFFGETWFLEYEQAINRLKEMEVMYGQSKVKTGD